jgi:hypothetical protein
MEMEVKIVRVENEATEKNAFYLKITNSEYESIAISIGEKTFNKIAALQAVDAGKLFTK